MSGPGWVERVNQTTRPEPPPKSGKGSSTEEWARYAAELGYPIPPSASRADIITIVESGPPPAPEKRSRFPRIEGPVYEATQASIKGATHLTPIDQPACAVLLDLAKQIDGMERRPANAPLDNVTIPMFLRYSESLGLTPQARQRLDVKPAKEETALEKARNRWGGRAAG